MTAIARDVSILNALGLHARAAARFVQTANRFQSAIRVNRGDRTVDGKSIMGILLLAAARGTILTIAAEGPDAAAAVNELCALVAAGFGEDR
jgi:phosphocarrier protein HPr